MQTFPHNNFNLMSMTGYEQHQVEKYGNYLKETGEDEQENGADANRAATEWTDKNAERQLEDDGR